MKIITALFLLCIVPISFVFGQVPRDGLVAYYTFDNDADSTVFDASGNNANGVIIGNRLWSDGIVGKALDLDGDTNYVDLGLQGGLFDFTEQITLMAWVNQRDAANGESNEWISKGDFAWCLKHRQDPFYEFFIYNGSWYVCRVVDADEIASHVDEWHHFAGTYDGFTIAIYVDGELRNTAEHEGFIDITQDPVYLGTNSTYIDRGFNGLLDEVCIYSVALDENQISAVYESSLSDVAQGSKQVSEFYLRQNYPNPFNPTTQITYSLPRTSEVKLQVYDMLGRNVATLIDGVQLQGEHTVSFQAEDLPSGIYFCKLQSGDQFTDMKKMMLVR